MNKYKSILSGLFAGVLITTSFFFALEVGGKSVITKKLATTPQVEYVSDEQLGINAVRKVKAVTVSIVGNVDYQTKGDAKIEATYGTGFIVDSGGYIVTNNHVVDDVNGTYSVITIDGSRYPAKLVGIDKFNDIALLKVDAKNLPVAVLGNSDGLETGQTVFAIGNPFGKFQHSVSKGVVSGLGRALNTGGSNASRMQNLIQTDAALNPGNSGGPLVNLQGEVVGVNFAAYDAQGVNFAVPINTVKDSVQQIRTFGKAARPYLGLNFLTITPTIQAVKGLVQGQGALVVSVIEKSPASLAGLKSGDIILAVNKQLITEQNELDTVLHKYFPGNQLLITGIRDGVQYETPVILGEYK